jgi:hypothetical protein
MSVGTGVDMAVRTGLIADLPYVHLQYIDAHCTQFHDVMMGEFLRKSWPVERAFLFEQLPLICRLSKRRFASD